MVFRSGDRRPFQQRKHIVVLHETIYDVSCWKWPSVWWMYWRQGVSHTNKSVTCKQSFIGIKGTNVFSSNYSTYYCTTSSSLDRKYKAGWIQTFMLFAPNSDPTIQMSQYIHQRQHVLYYSKTLANWRLKFLLLCVVFFNCSSSSAARIEVFRVQGSISLDLYCNHLN